MLFRNISNNIQPNLDISDRMWRRTEITVLVVAENYDATREIGWPTHSETLGFGSGSSSVTVLAGGAGASMLAPATNQGWQGNWTRAGLTNLLPMPGANLSATGDTVNGTATAVLYSPAQARLMQDEHGSKDALMASRRHTLEVQQNNPSHPNYNPNDPLRIRGNLLNVTYPLIVGEDPSGAYSLSSGLYYSGAFNNQKITGAAGNAAAEAPSTVGNTAPSAPRSLTVSTPALDSATGTYSATLTWDTPASDGGSPVTRYEVYYLNGILDMDFRWLEVPGGASARSVTFTNLLPGVQYEFKVRARNGVDNALIFQNPSGDFTVNPSFFNARYNILTNAQRVERLGGRGGWAVAPPTTIPGRMTVINSNNFPQIVGQDGPGIKLYYGDPYFGEAGELFYGPNGKIWNHLGQRVDRKYITSLKIDTPAMLSVSRNSRLQLDLITNPTAGLDYVVWSASDASFATVDQTGLVTVMNKMGMVVVTAKDTDSGRTHSVVLRIT
jgi:hypothetical protein